MFPCAGKEILNIFPPPIHHCTFRRGKGTIQFLHHFFLFLFLSFAETHESGMRFREVMSLVETLPGSVTEGLRPAASEVKLSPNCLVFSIELKFLNKRDQVSFFPVVGTSSTRWMIFEKGLSLLSQRKPNLYFNSNNTISRIINFTNSN